MTRIVKELVTLTSLDYLYVVATAALPILLWLGITKCKKPHMLSGNYQVRRCFNKPPSHTRTRRKPPWVTDELIRLKAHLPDAGCRTLAITFNRLFADKEMSVGKTFVAQTMQKHRYEIQVLRRTIKKRPAY